MPLRFSKKIKHFIQRIFIFVFIVILLVVLCVGMLFWRSSFDLPKMIHVTDYHPLGVTRVVAFSGKIPESFEKSDHLVEVAEFFKERRYLVSYEKIPKLVIQAFVAAEDDRFFDHSGVNFFSMIRAAIANLKAGRVVQGGSTITQQITKSLLLTPEKSFDRKIKEILLASQIEKNLNKQQILYLYLNQIYLGHGAYGVQAASRAYFNKDVSELTLSEAALLAGLPQAPSKYSPLINPKKSKERQVYVLKRMLENQYITLSQMQSALQESLKIHQDEDSKMKYAPYYIESIRRYLLEKYGEKSVYEDGLTVYVPLNPDLSIHAMKSLKNGLLAIDKRLGYRGIVQHLNTDQEIQTFLNDVQTKMIEKKLHYQLLLPEGRLDSEVAMRLAGIESDLQLLEEDELYLAVVTAVDLSKKNLSILVGPHIKGKVSLINMSSFLNGFSIQKGDVIWVRLNHEFFKKQIIHQEESFLLEQQPTIQGALFSMDTHTGNVTAMVGGYDFAHSEYNRAVQAMRQPGSAFKPIVYTAALEKGFTPASLIADSPIVFKNLSGMNWKPNNYEEKFYGDTTFRQAFVKSRNIPTIKILQSIQIPYVLDYVKKLGIHIQLNPDLSIALGSGSVSLMELTKAFALFPRLGRKVEPNFVLKIFNRDDALLEEGQLQPPWIANFSSSPPLQGVASSAEWAEAFATNAEQVLDPRIAYVMTHLMKAVVTSGTGHAAMELNRPVAGKTGTTNDSIDGWFIGFTPQLITGVWVGFDNQKSMGNYETGARTALPIWLDYMREAVRHESVADFIPPPGIVFVTMDPRTGKLAPSDAPGATREAFVDGTQPVEVQETAESAKEVQSNFFQEDRD